MRCDHCSRSEATAYVELNHNVGMVFARRSYTTAAELCRGCLGKAFWHHTLRNLTLGWWGTISFFVTWYYLLSNLVTYVQARAEMGRSPRQATPVVAAARGDAALRILQPFEHNVRMQLRMGDDPADIARDMARLHGVEAAAAHAFVEQIRASA
ncbi:hypothetical protein LZ198_39775 [Myxococcus sp. K15C18031901]|uniref:hypothetical protein n=1 Tax=Myxococcus dinghuensis TaxID=2906761 RepID=UPI0020A7DF6C|nr:hypothetical protein [Myxococcus dinghuensis]MCP3105024.1 hypothetical protein [Myxococcus dinghuensis]